MFQPLPVGGEIEGIACFPVGAAFGLQVEFGIVGFQQVDVGGGCFVNAGEAGRLRETGEQAAVVGQIVADGDDGRPCAGFQVFGHGPYFVFVGGFFIEAVAAGTAHRSRPLFFLQIGCFNIIYCSIG